MDWMRGVAQWGDNSLSVHHFEQPLLHYTDPLLIPDYQLVQL